jgi:hypothetical protein
MEVREEFRQIIVRIIHKHDRQRWENMEDGG